MARKAIEVVAQEETKKELSASEAKKLRKRLDNLIPIYGVNKSQADELKAIMADDNKEIKAICKQLDLNKVEVDGWEMTYRIDTKHDVNEDKMLEIIKKWWVKKNGSMECPYVRIEEHVDNEAIQDAIYRGDIDKDVLTALRACDTEKQEEKLFVKKAKEKKNG